MTPTFLRRFRRFSGFSLTGVLPTLGWAAPLLLAVVCAGCLSKAPRPWESAGAEVPRTLVFGKINLVSQGDENPVILSKAYDGVSPGSPGPKLMLSLFQVETGQRGVFTGLEADGTFVQPLPRGTYLIILSRPAPAPANEVLAAFQSPGFGRPRYLGTLGLNLARTRDETDQAGNFAVTTLTVKNELASAVEALGTGYPGLSKSSDSGLMITDPAFTSLFYNYSRRNCEELLARHRLFLLDSAR